MPATLELSPEQIAHYRTYAQKRLQSKQPDIEKRREQAWNAARKAAKLLKKKYGATRVVVFGSLTQNTSFTSWSDVDIAAWGLRLEDTFRAIGSIMDIETEVPVNLVDINTASTSLLNAIENQGVTL